MNKSIGLLLVALTLVVAVAVAGEMTAEEAMQRMMNCVACQPYGEYPQLGPNIRYDVFNTADGFVATFMVADEKLAPQFKECNKNCKAKQDEAMKLSAEERESKLCPFCEGMFELMAREDVAVKEFDAALGEVVVASSSSKEGVEALHKYADNAKKTSKLLEEAAMKMQTEKK